MPWAAAPMATLHRGSDPSATGTPVIALIISRTRGMRVMPPSEQDVIHLRPVHLRLLEYDLADRLALFVRLRLRFSNSSGSVRASRRLAVEAVHKAWSCCAGELYFRGERAGCTRSW